MCSTDPRTGQRMQDPYLKLTVFEKSSGGGDAVS